MRYSIQDIEEEYPQLNQSIISNVIVTLARMADDTYILNK